MQNSSGTKDKVVVITGASSGIGEATALLLAERGAKVVLGARGPDRLEALAARIAASGGEVAYARTDVKRREDVSKLVGVAIERYGKLDVLVNNAGTVALGRLGTFDLNKWHHVIDVNLTGTFLGMRAVVEPMTSAGGGSIINISSIEGLRGAPLAHPYVASKWGVRGLTKSAALELAPRNIRVNSVHPGFIRTPMTAHLPEDLVTIPLGRAGDAHEVATFVLFLASDESSYSTGSEFIVDGGLVTAVPTKPA